MTTINKISNEVLEVVNEQKKKFTKAQIENMLSNSEADVIMFKAWLAKLK